MYYIKHLLRLAVVVYVILSQLSCTNTKKATYFNDQPDGVINYSAKVPETIIQPKDILGISVSSLNATASNVFNAANFSANSTTNTQVSSQPSGYLVDSSGYLQFPLLGNVKASGKTSNQLRQEIVSLITSKGLLVDPIVTIRYLNYRVTVLGEVGHPSVINVPSEKISLLEALGLAGDVTIYGRKDNVMLIREQGDSKLVKRLDLNSGDLFNSPYYYLQSNDVVYVEANKAKVSSSKQSTQMIPILLSVLSFLAIIATQVIRNN